MACSHHKQTTLFFILVFFSTILSLFLLAAQCPNLQVSVSHPPFPDNMLFAPPGNGHVPKSPCNLLRMPYRLQIYPKGIFHSSCFSFSVPYWHFGLLPSIWNTSALRIRFATLPRYLTVFQILRSFLCPPFFKISIAFYRQYYQSQNLR